MRLPILVLAFWTSSLFANGHGSALFQYEGKSYYKKDLNPALQQAIYEMERQSYERLQKIIDAHLLEKYASEEAKKKGLTVEKFAEQTFQGRKVTEKEAKDWFETNKSRLGGREFNTIKSDIMQLLQSQEDEKVRATVVAKIKKDGKFQTSLTEPKAPVVNISVEGFPSKGAKNPKVTIVEFADYKCPHCRDASKTLKAVYEKYKDKVQMVYLDFPIDRSGLSRTIAEGAACADKQNKFWEYHYKAFDEQSNLNANSPMEFAKQLNLDSKAFETCMKTDEVKNKIEKSRKEGERVGIEGTPTIFFNGQKIVGHSQENLEESLKKLL